MTKPDETQDLIGKAHRIEFAALNLVLGMTFCVLLYAIGSMVQMALEMGAFR
mgnify:CR=1 FL=1